MKCTMLHTVHVSGWVFIYLWFFLFPFSFFFLPLFLFFFWYALNVNFHVHVHVITGSGYVKNLLTGSHYYYRVQWMGKWRYIAGLLPSLFFVSTSCRCIRMYFSIYTCTCSRGVQAEGFTVWIITDGNRLLTEQGRSVADRYCCAWTW